MPNRLERRYRIMLELAAGSVLFILLVRLAYLPLLGHLRQELAAARDVRVKLADAQIVAGDTARRVSVAAHLKQQRVALRARLGNGQALARILNGFRHDAEAHRLQCIVTQPSREAGLSAEVVGADIELQEVPLTITLTGAYRSIGEFLGAFRTAPFIAEIRQVSVQRSTTVASRLEATIGLVVLLAKEAVL